MDVPTEPQEKMREKISHSGEDASDGRGGRAEPVSERSTPSGIDAPDLEPGAYHTVCRVGDRAKPSARQHPFAFRDADPLLWSATAWDVLDE